MNSNEFLGMLIVGLGTLGGLIAVAWRCFKPINDLNVNIVKLNATIESLIQSIHTHEKRLNAHSSKIDEINKKLWEHAGTLDSHDERIKRLEHEKEGGDI